MRKRETMAHRRPLYGLSINPVPRSQTQKKTCWNHRSVGNPKKCNGGHGAGSQVVRKRKGPLRDISESNHKEKKRNCRSYPALTKGASTNKKGQRTVPSIPASCPRCIDDRRFRSGNGSGPS